ncbi:MAG: hypothetical protein IKP76_00650, partial [Bacilli bacterium]|nr:hypothetical protein [Bacilli bacterium]
MKDRHKKILKVLLLTVVPITIVALLLSFLGTKVLNKTYALDEGMNNISQFVDENDNPTSVSFVLEYLDGITKENVDGNQVQVTSNDNIEISFLDAKTNEEITVQDNTVTLSQTGTIVKINGIEKGNVYDIKIKPIENRVGLMPSYKEATIKIDFNDNLTANISKLVDNDGQEVELSENERMVFLYSDTEDKIKLRSNEDVEISYYYSLDELSNEELESKEFVTYNKDNYLKVETNGYLYAKSRYKTDGYSKVSMLHITNIDKLKPVITHTTPVERPNKQSATVSFTINDADATKEYGKSGIVKYAFSLSDNPDESEFINVSQDDTYSTIVDDNGTYYVVAYDEAGNKTVHEIQVTEISWDEENYVILILQSDVPELVGREYHSLKAMKEDFESLNLTNSDKVLAQIEGNITNQSLIVENVDLSIDLNGYTINTRDDVPSFTVNSDTNLKIIDNKYDISDYLSGDYSRYNHGDGYGKINNNKNAGMKVNENSSLTIGEDNSPDLAHIEYPDHNSPIITGKTRAIINNGTFNYYDGVLKGSKTIDGTINDTPPLYDPNITRDEEDNYIFTLEKVVDIEALIGKTRYTLLEDAIFAANNLKGTPQDQIKIDIVKDIEKDHTIEISDQKNIILNTNGFNVTTTINESVITNYGKLVLMNSLNTGKITRSGEGYIVDNKYNATLTIDSGTLESNIWGNHVIVNREDATVNVTGGTIKHTNYANGIYNIGGIVNVTGGELNVTTRENNVYEERNNVIVNKDITMKNHEKSEINVSLDDVVSNGDYYFVKNSSDILESNNTNIDNSVANSYFELDFRNISPDTKVRVLVEARTTSENGYDFGYLTVKDDTTAPTWDTESGRFYLQSGPNATSFSTYTVDLQGGKIHYLHLGYRKDGGTSHNEDKMFVKSIKYYELKTYYGRTNITEGNFSGARVCYYNLSKGEYARVNGGAFGCEYSVYNPGGEFHVDNGTINGTIGNYSNGKNYIHNGTVNHIHNGNGSTYISGGNVSSIQNSDRYASDRGDEYLYITGGVVGSIDNGYYLDAKNCEIHGVSSDSFIETNYYNVKFSQNITEDSSRTHNIVYISRVSNDYAAGTVNFNKCEFNIGLNGNTSRYYNIPNIRNIVVDGASNVNLDEVTMHNTVLNNMTFGDDSNEYKTLFTGIIFNSTGTLNLKNTNILMDNTINGNKYTKLRTYGITTDGKSIINLGVKDGDYLENDVVIEGDTAAIDINKSTLNFYDGTLIGGSYALNSTVSEIEDNYCVYRYTENNKDIMKLSTHISNVLNEDTGVTYSTITEALSVPGITTANLKLIGDYIYEPDNTKLEIKSTMIVNLDLNGKNLYFGDGFLNNGEFNIKDTSDTVAKIRTHECINNNILKIDAGSWYFEYTSSNGILNNGNATISNSTFRGNWAYKQENMFNNNGTLRFKDGADLNSNGNSLMKLIYNYDTGKLYIDGGKFDAYDWIGSGQEGYLPGRIIYNKGGYAEINGGTISGRVGGAIYYDGQTTMIYNESIPPKYTVTNRDWKIWYSDGVIFMTDDGPAYYVEADLTEYEGDVTITVKSYGNYWGSQDLSITTSPNRPSTSEHYSGTIRYNEDVWSKTVQGGQKYYIHVDGSEVFTDDITITHNGVTTSLYKKAEMVINGGTIQAENYGTMINVSHSSLTMNNGTIKQISGVDGTGISVAHHGTVNINGGTIQNKGTGVNYDSYSDGKITGGTFKVDGGSNVTQINVGRGYVDIDDVEIIGNSTSNFKGITVSEASTANISGGSISINSTRGYENLGLNIGGSSKVHVQNFETTITNNLEWNSSYWSAAVNLSGSSETTINDSSFICNSNANMSCYGIRAVDSATITLSNEDGNEDGHVSQTTPVISGTSAGITRSGGVFNYYDGIIKGNTQISGGISDRPEGYELLYGNDGTLPTVVLEKVIVAINTDTLAEYTTLQSAFNACEDDTVCNIQLQVDLILSKQIEVPDKKIIIFDMNNKKIDVTEKKNIKNNGYLKVSKGTVNVTAIQDGTCLFDNYGYLEFNDGMVLNENEYYHSRLIVNNPKAKVVINGGTFTSSTWGYMQGGDSYEEGKVIYNKAGTVEINGGTLNGVSHSGYWDTARSYMNTALTAPYNIESGSSIYDTDGRIYMNYDSFINIPIDLTGYSGNVDVVAKYRTNREPLSWIPTGFYVDESPSKPGDVTWDYSSLESTINGEFVKTLEGGRKYYLHVRGYGLLINDVFIRDGDNIEDLFTRPKFIINGGTINETGGNTSFFLYNGSLEINGGTINNAQSGTLFYIAEGSDVKMTNGTISGSSSPIEFEGYSRGKFTGGTIKNLTSDNWQYGLNIGGGFVDIDNVNIQLGTADAKNSLRRCIFAANGSVVNINDMTCTVYGTTEVEAIYATDSSTVNVKGGTYNVYGGGGSPSYPDRDSARGISMYGSSKVNVSGNTTFNVTSASEGVKTFGVYMERYSNQTLTISNNDDTVSTDYPLIKSRDYGLFRNSGTFNFYDGKIYGQTQLMGGVTSIPENYELYFGTDSEEKNYVVLSNEDFIINTDTNVTYKDINVAINACVDDTECNLKLLNNIYLFDVMEVPTTKIVNLDLGKKRLIEVEERNIVNKGTLRLSNGHIDYDSFKEYIYYIDNYGTLVINDGTEIRNENLSGWILNRLRVQLINNRPNANVIVNGGLLVNTTWNEYSLGNDGARGRIINNSGGYVEINGGKIYTQSHDYYGTTRSFINTTVPINPVKTGGGYDPYIDSGCVSNNYRSRYYIPIDLSNYSGTVDVDIQYNHWSNDAVDFYITEDTTQPGSVTPDLSFTSAVNYATFTKSLTGGRIYYLHINAEKITISDIRVKQENTNDSLFTRGKMVFNNLDLIDYGNTWTIIDRNGDLVFNKAKFEDPSDVNALGIQLNRGSTIVAQELTFKNYARDIEFNGYSKGDIDKYTSTSYGQYNKVLLNINEGRVSFGEISLDLTGASNLTGILINNGSSFELTKANITASCSSDTYAIKVAGNTDVKIGDDVTIVSTGNTNTAVGINVADSSTVQIGTNDGTVSTTKPSVRGDSVALNIGSSATVKWYDGVMISDNNPISGKVTEIPQDYKISVVDNTRILEVDSHVENTYEFNHSYYPSLASAIEAIADQSSKTGTIKIWNDVSLSTAVEIPADVNVTFALEGHTITFNNLSTSIVNNGTLTIIDGDNDEIDEYTSSGITNANGTVIQNNGTLVIGVQNNPNANSPTITGSTGYTGTAPTIYSGSISSTSNPIINAGKAIIKFFANLIQPSFAYKTSEYQVNNLGSDVALSDSPKLKAVEDLTKWTNDGVNIGMTAHNYGVFNIASDVDDGQTKILRYTVELYKDNSLVDTVVKTKKVQVLSKDELEIDQDFFTSAHNKYSGYSISKVTQNDNVLPIKNNKIEVDKKVSSGTVFKIYYTKNKKKTTSLTTEIQPEPEPVTEPTTEETTTSRKTTTTEEVKGDVVIVVKNDFPWWIVAVVAGGLGLIGLLIWLLPILLRKSVLIAISGSVGSAVAAKLLQERQCKVTALFINTGTNLQQLTYAKQVCSKLGIDLYEQEINGEYRTRLLEGITNNPNTDLDKIYNKYILIDM